MQNSLVLSNLFHHPTRTLVSIIGIAVGVLLILFTIGLANGTLRARARAEANVGAEIMVRASGTFGLSGSDPFRLATADATEIAGVEDVQAAVPLGQNLVAAADNNSNSRLVDGIRYEEYAQLSGLKIVEGRALKENGDEAIVDTNWRKSNKLEVGSKLKMYDRDFTIVGDYEPAVGGRIKIPLATMQEQLGGEGKCTAILVKVADGAEPKIVAERISQKFPDTQIIFTKDIEELYSNSIPALNVFLNVVIGVAAGVSALIILLTMYTTVTERTRQIGVLKSLGMSKAGIAWTITQEALLMSFLGATLGIVATFALRLIVTNTTSMRVQMEWKILVSTLLVALIGAALGALYPALRAARLDAVEALSYE